MDTLLSRERLHTIYDQSTRFVTERTSGILLNEEDVSFSEEICTIYTTFERHVSSGLAMCADLSLLTRLTQHMMKSEHVDLQDVEDFSKEYFNVLCGHIAASLFRDTRVSVRFQIPVFYYGWYQPEHQQESWKLRFLSDHNECVWLIHYQDSGVANKENRMM